MVQTSSALVIATALVISATSSFATHLRLSDITGLSRRDLEAVNPSYLLRRIPDLELDARGIAEFADIVGREVNELNERDIRETLVHVLKRYDDDDGEGGSPDDNDDPEIIDSIERRGVLEGADALLPRRNRKDSKRQTHPMNIGRREPQVAPHLDPRVIYGRSHQGETKRNSRVKRSGKGSGKRTASMSKPASTPQKTSKGPSRR